MKKPSNTTTSLRSIFGPQMAEALCAQGDILLQALKRFDPTFEFVDLVADASLAAAILQVDIPTNQDEQEDQTFFNYASMQWAKWSRPTFVLTRELCSALLLTDCRGIRGRDLKFPYLSFCLAIPKDAGLYVRDSDGTSWPVTVIQATCGRTMQRHETSAESKLYSATISSILDKGLPSGELLHALRTYTQKAREQLRPKTNLWSSVRLLSTEHPTGLSMYRVYVLPTEEEALEGWLAGPRKTKGTLGVGDDEEHVLALCHRLVANFILYLSSHDLPAPERQSTVLKQRRNQTANIYRVGGEVRLPGHLMEAARAAVQGSKQPAAWRVRSRFVVRGHWRNQAHGPGRLLRERKWIQPFWKGPTTAESLSRIYKTE